MLELIFQGFIEWLYSLVLDCWNWLSSSLLDIMSLDLDYIKSHVPIITDIMQVLLAVGWALLLGNLVFQAMKGMASGLGFEAEDPKMLFGRSAVFSFLLLASPQLCEIVLDMTARVITLLELPNAVNVHLVDASILGNLFAGWLVVIVCNFIIMWKVLKLLLKIAEQYVVLSTLTIAAPLAFSMGGSKSTVSIFTGWCRMYGSMCLLMVSNVMFFKMLLSVMSAIPSGLDVIPWMVLIFSIVKVAKRMDDTITRIGLNPAMAGAPGGRSLPGMLAASVMHGVVSQVTRTIGGAIGGAVGSAAGNVVGGVAGAGTAAAGTAATGLSGLASILRSGGGRNTPPTPQNSSGQQNTQQNESQQEPVRQSAGQPGGSRQGNFAQDGENTSNTPSQFNQRGSGTRRSRNTSVPPGTRRAPSYVPPPSSGDNAAGSGTASQKPSRGGGFSDSRTGGGGLGTGRGGSFGGGSRGGGFGDSRTSGGGLGTGRGGSFGGGSRGGGFGDSRTSGGGFGTSRGGSFGRGSQGRDGADGTTEYKNTKLSQSSAAGTGQPSHPVSGTPVSGTPGTGAVEKTAAKGGSPKTVKPGMAGTGHTAVSDGGTVKNKGTPSRISGMPSGTADTGIPPTSARSTRYQTGEKPARQHIADAAKTAAAPGKGTSAGQSTRPAETRSTHREKVHSERTTADNTIGRTGAAGTPPIGSARQPGKAVPPAAGISPPKRQDSSPAQQEARQTSVPGRPRGTAAVPPGAAGTSPAPTVSAKRQQSGPARQERGKSPAAPTLPATAADPDKRSGLAGTAPDRSRVFEKGRTARNQARRAKGQEGMTSPVKRPGIGSAPPASKQQSGAKPPDRSGHGGGGSHGG